MRRILPLALAALLACAAVWPAGAASAKTFDTWPSVTAALSGLQTPWEPRHTIGLTLDPKLGIDVTRCTGKKGYLIHARYASPRNRRAFSIVEQPNGVNCVRTNMSGYGRIGIVRVLGYTFDIYGRCKAARCPGWTVVKRGLVRMRPASPGASVSSVRIATKGLTYEEVRWLTEGLALPSFN